MRPISSLVTLAVVLASCGAPAVGADAGSSIDAGSVADAGPNVSETGADGGCALAENATDSSNVNAAGCAVRDRDTSSCQAARESAGLSGYWLKFSCRVALTATSSLVTADSDGQPDYVSNYFPTTNACWESYTGAIQNPNLIATQHLTVSFPLSTNTTSASMRGVAIVGLAVNGVPVYGNFAAPGDDIYQEARTFDRCGGHPQGTGEYHYHCEPYAITDDDDNFVGVMRDGYPIYGRKDPDGSTPTTLDTYGGHTGFTIDSPTTAVYHYHVNQQTSTASTSEGEMQWFLTTGTFRGTPASCLSCN